MRPHTGRMGTPDSNRTVRVIFLTAAAGPGPRAAPFGAARVASALKAEPGLSGRIAVDIVEGLATDAPADLTAGMGPDAPDVIGLSMYSWNHALLAAAGRAARARFPAALVVAGGPEASADPEGILREAVADVVVAGEGERAMVDIVTALLRGEEPPGPILRPPPADLGSLPSPWLDGTLDPARWGGAALELARGCPFSCAFCFESKGDRRVRRFPLERAARELEAFAAAGVDEVFVLDPTFNADARRMEEAVGIMRERGPGLRYLLELRAELLDRRQAHLLSTVDCSVQVGLQSADTVVMAAVDRSFDPAAFARKVRLLDEAGVVYGLDLMYGLPGDTLDGFCASLDYALGLGPNHLDVFRLAVLPGTALADRASALGLDHDPRAPYLVRSTPTFPAADLDRADRLAAAVDAFYNRGRAVPWFRALARAVRMKPVGIVESFARFLGNRTPPKGQAEAEALQLEFLRELAQGPKPALADAAVVEAAADTIRASGAWTRALAEGEETDLRLGWDPELLLDEAPLDIRRFAREIARTPGRWRCSPSPSGPRFARVRTQSGTKRNGGP